MTAVTTGDGIFDRLVEFVRRELFGDEEAAETGDLDATTPLLQLGILNSMNTARLLSFIRSELGVNVPPMYITGKHFQDLGAITALVLDLSATREQT